MYGGEQLIEHIQNKNFEFVKGDIRNENHVKKNIEDADVIIHLAAIVGYPACSKNKKFATDINVNGTKNVLKYKKKNQLIIYASTGSNYGSIAEICTEETKLNPLTVYGKIRFISLTIFEYVESIPVVPTLLDEKSAELDLSRPALN